MTTPHAKSVDSKEWLDRLARELLRELTASTAIKAFVHNNSALIGAFAEASVRAFASRTLSPLRISRGSIIHEGNIEADTPELDAVIWAPRLSPAVFDVGDFALVPRGNAFAYLEVKRSLSSNTVDQIVRVFALKDELLPRWENEPVVSVDGKERELRRTFAVICLQEQTQSIPQQVKEWERAGCAAVLMKQRDGALEPDPRAIYSLCNFLAEVRYRSLTMPLTTVRFEPFFPV